MPEGLDGALSRFVATLKQTEPANPHVVSRIVRAVSGDRRAPSRSAGWWARRRTLTVRAIAGLAVAATAAGLVLGGALDQLRRTSGHSSNVAAAPGSLEPLQLPMVLHEVASREGSGEGPMLVQFLFHAPAARSVALVGDFNGWDPRAEPLRRDANGLWTATVVLNSGQHAFAYIVDDSVWTRDPNRPVVEDADFGRPHSVITVGGL